MDRRLPGVGLLGVAGSAEDERAVAAVGPRNRRHPRTDRAEAVAHAGEERDVDEAPAEPSQDTRELDRPGLQEGMAPADVGRRTEVAIAEILALGPLEVAPDAGRDVQTALHRVL